MSLTPRQWLNVTARTTVWLVIFLVWLQLQKPAGASLDAARPGRLGALGAILVLGGVALLLWSVVILAGAIPGEARLTGHLIDRGPYRYSRNPLYLAAAAVCLGIYLLYAPMRGVDLVIGVLLGALVQWAVVRLEEPATRRRLGSAFETYERRVPRWLPGPWQ